MSEKKLIQIASDYRKNIMNKYDFSRLMDLDYRNKILNNLVFEYTRLEKILSDIDTSYYDGLPRTHEDRIELDLTINLIRDIESVVS